MLRLILLLLTVIAVASGLAWLADRPGLLVLNWQGYEVETSVFRAVVILGLTIGLAVVLWNLLRQIWLAPAALGGVFQRRRQKRGLDALSSGMIALGAGDQALATRYALQARRTLPNEPLTHLLRAQAARLAGDQTTARRIFEAMLASPDTEQLGLRGLFVEAENEGETEAARQFAERALKLNPKLGWAADALFDIQCKQADWDGALETLAIARRNGHVEKASADRRRAVLLTAKAQAAEETDPEKALAWATEAHGLAVDLIPAAAIAGRILASRGNTPRATRIIQQTWPKSPHPDLAIAYAYARLGDSPRDRLDRIKQLASLAPMSIESAIAVASTAIEAREWDVARESLEDLIDERLTQRVCTLMARVEGEQYGDKGRVREWLARAVNAPRDPAWTADGVVSETWQPVSPVTGVLDAFRWRVPIEQAEKRDADLIARKLEELVALGAPQDSLVPDERIVEIEADEVITAEVGTASTGKVSVAGKDGIERSEPAGKDATVPAGEARPAPAPKPMETKAAEPKAASSAPSAPAIKSSEPEVQRAPAEIPVETAAHPAPAKTGATPKATDPPVVVVRGEVRSGAATREASHARPPPPAESAASAAARAANASAPSATINNAEAKTSADGHPGQAKGGESKPGEAKAGVREARIFVSPRPPDDPGLETAEADDVGTRQQRS